MAVVKLVVLILFLASSMRLILRHAMAHIRGRVLLAYRFREVVNHAKIALVKVLRVKLDRLRPGHACVRVGC